MPLYGQDLAYIHAVAFGGLARGASAEIVRLLKSAGTPIHRVVDAGCGAGVLTAALIEAGFDVTGVDNSADLLAIAGAHVPQARFVNASLYELGIPACQAILAIGEPLTYHAEGEEADRLVGNLFRRASAALPCGGLLIFDVIEIGGLSLDGKSWSSGDNWAVLVETREDPASRTLVRTIETFRRVDHLYRRGREVHRVHLFDTGELSSRLAECGFAIETAQAYGAYQLGPRRRAFFCTRR